MPNKIINKTCEYCKNKNPIKFQSNWSKHIKTKKHLKNKKEYEEQEEEINKSKQQDLYCNVCDITIKNYTHWNRHLKSKTHLEKEKINVQTINNNCTTNNTTNSHNNINSNNNINITLNNFGEEKIEFTKEILEELEEDIKNGSIKEVFLTLIDMIHSIEENRNLIKTNMKNKYVQFYQDGKFILAPEKEIINKRIDNIPDMYLCESVKTKKETKEKSVYSSSMNHTRKLRKINDDDKKEVHEKIKCDSYNDKYIIEDN